MRNVEVLLNGSKRVDRANLLRIAGFRIPAIELQALEYLLNRKPAI